jgi:hypothetical protein
MLPSSFSSLYAMSYKTNMIETSAERSKTLDTTSFANSTHAAPDHMHCSHTALPCQKHRFIFQLFHANCTASGVFNVAHNLIAKFHNQILSPFTC